MPPSAHSYEAVDVSEVAMQNHHRPCEPEVLVVYSLKLAVLVMSCESTVPPSEAGSTQADTVNPPLFVLTAAPVVASALEVPLRVTSGLNRLPVFHDAPPEPVSASVEEPVVSAAVPTLPEVPSASDQVCVADKRVWAGCAAKVAVPDPSVAR